MRNTILFSFLVVCAHCFTQSAFDLIKGVNAKISLIKDYKAEIQIKAAIPFIKVPLTNATIYYKKYDKFKVVSKGIAILPKQGTNDLTRFLSNSSKYVPVLGEQKVINQHTTRLVTVIPTEENNEIILAKVYISPSEKLIYRSVVTTKSSGTMTVDYEYGNNKAYGLPSKMTFTVDVKKFKMPKSVAADIRSNTAKKKYNENEKGTIVLTVTRYAINIGLTDAFFKTN